jgi:hypothetical protein
MRFSGTLDLRIEVDTARERRIAKKVELMGEGRTR